MTRTPRILALIPMVLLTSNAPDGGNVKHVSEATVEVGRVFGQGGTDGLILYALILATFLMFLALVTVLMMAFRTINRQTSTSAAQGTAFAEASKEVADSLGKLATNVAVKGAEDASYRLAATGTMARVERELSRIEGRPNV